jgi:hypothetical protein
VGKIRRIIPFGFWPANWGLEGSRREKAFLEYHWDGEDLAYKLLDVDFPDHGSKEDFAYRLAKLKLDYRFHKVSEYDYGLGLIQYKDGISETDRERDMAKYLHKFGKLSAEELEYKLLELSYVVKDTEDYRIGRLKLDVRYGKKSEEEADHELLDLKHEDKSSIEYKIDQLGLELKWGNIDQNEHDKDVATLLREPWFNIIGADHKVNGENTQMAIELDWNEFFVQFLESKGWTGVTADEIVDKWFEEAMRQMLKIDENGDIDDGEDLPLAAVSRTKRDDGLTEYR